jgi:predicted metalloprotease
MKKLVRFKTGMAFGLLSIAGLAGVGVVDNSAALYAAGREPAAVEVTSSDIAASNAKVRMAHSALSKMWTGYFREVGHRFAVPALMRYRGGAVSSCGLMRRNNAGYCPTDNTIYFDEVFVAAQAKEAGNSLGTDGDMAAVGIIAHEMGHAVSLRYRRGVLRHGRSRRSNAGADR